MGNCIGFGEYNKNTKYLIYYIIFNFLYIGISGLAYGSLYYPIKFYKKQEVINNHNLIIEIFGYFGIFLLSFILIKYEPDNLSKKYVFDKDSSTIKLVVEDKTTFRKNKSDIFLVAFTWLLHIQLVNIYYKSDFGYLDYWACEMIITYYISKNMFNMQIYSHQKFAIGFITIFCSSLIFCTFMYTIENQKDIIYRRYPACIPIGIILYLIILFIRAYSNCKIKWLTDLKYISTGKLLSIYGIVGVILNLIICTITTLVDCGKNKLNLCYMEKDGKPYYENFIIFFDEYFRDSFKFIDIILLIFIIIFKFFTSLFYVLTIKYLTPFYAVCLPSIYYFLLQVILLFNTLIQHKTYIITNNLPKVCIEILTDFFSILGIFVYIEFIEIKICHLNYNTRRKIRARSIRDTEIKEIRDMKEIFNDEDEYVLFI